MSRHYKFHHNPNYPDEIRIVNDPTEEYPVDQIPYDYSLLENESLSQVGSQIDFVDEKSLTTLSDGFVSCTFSSEADDTTICSQELCYYIYDDSNSSLGSDDSICSLKDIVTILYLRDVQELIFKRLPFDSKLCCRLICKQWKLILDDILLFNPILCDGSADDVMKFGPSENPVNILTVTHLNYFWYPEEGLGLSHVREIRLEPSANPCIYHPQPTIILDQITLGISEANLARLLAEFPNIEALGLASGSLQDAAHDYILMDINLPKLKHFNLFSYTGHYIGRRAIRDFLFQNYFPCLESIDTVFLNGIDMSHHAGPLEYREIFQFIARHKKTLKEVCLTFESNLDKTSTFERIKPFISQISDEDLNKDLESIELESFLFRPHVHEGFFGHNFGYTLLTSQNHLKTLELKDMDCPQLFQGLSQVFIQCSKTLEEVIIKGCFCPTAFMDNDGNPQFFSCSSIKNCLRLKTFLMEVCGPKISNIEELPSQIQSLALGQCLDRQQIDFITQHMHQLQHLKLFQGRQRDVPSIPKIDSQLFKQTLIRVPTLRKLTMKKTTSAYKRIRRIVWFTQGLNLKEIEFSNGCYEITVDETKFDRNKF